MPFGVRLVEMSECANGHVCMKEGKSKRQEEGGSKLMEEHNFKACSKDLEVRGSIQRRSHRGDWQGSPDLQKS